MMDGEQCGEKMLDRIVPGKIGHPGVVAKVKSVNSILTMKIDPLTVQSIVEKRLPGEKIRKNTEENRVQEMRTRTQCVGFGNVATHIAIANGWVLLHFADTMPIQSVQVIQVNGPKPTTVKQEMEHIVHGIGRLSVAKLDGMVQMTNCYCFNYKFSYIMVKRIVI